MAKRRLVWRLFSSYVIVIFLAIIAVTLYMTGSMKRFYLIETSNDLRARSTLLKDQLSVGSLDSTKVDSLCKTFGKDSGTRFTVILPSGKVIGDTDNDPSKMENHANRPEIIDALSGLMGVSTRYSHTLSETMMYVAIPITQDGKIAGVVRAALPITAIDDTFAQIYPRIVFGGLIIALLSGIFSFYLSRRISIPLERIQLVAADFSKGEFGHKLPLGNSVEIDELSIAMNQMAAELDDKMRTVTGQRNELDAVLSSMIEGVLAFDSNERLVNLNLAASKMLGIDKDQARGHYVQEITRYVDLQKLVSRILENKKPDEIEIEGDGGQILQTHGTILRNDKSQNLGVLVVLNDITRLRHLEKMRRDFVANVSHELRTPITSIKGFVETLQEGAIRDSEDTERFLVIIAKQADRLNSIITDLLALSQIEETEKSQMRLEEHAIKEVLIEAVSACALKAGDKKITVRLNYDDDIIAKINPELLRQAIINLLDNAIKYSDEGGKVDLSAQRTSSEIIISVQDWGIGIEKKHLPRLFERFYTVDKARSRELGGTGLGLSIVKHIVLAHHGNITVDSTPDKGSTFSVHLPTTK
jgi:two-component system, OmpR family, phosphate regulon sensor histidine kinase PhoR